MEIPVISRISGFESELNRLQNHPSFISRLINLSSGIGEIFQVYGVWTLGALILAFLATFSSLIRRRRTRLVIFSFRKGNIVNSDVLVSSITTTETDDEYESDYEDDDTCSVSSSSDGEEDATSSLDEQDLRVKGGSEKLSNSFSWTDFVNGKGVVKSWDGLGLGFGGSSGNNLLSLWDFGNSGGGKFQSPVVSMQSPSVIVSAGFENSKNVAFRIWDTRAGRQIPELFAEWQPCWRSVTGGPVMVGDVRKLTSPLEDLMESEGKATWWDSDAVILDGDRKLCGLDWKDCGSVVSRCRNAVLSCFTLEKVGNYI